MARVAELHEALRELSDPMLIMRRVVDQALVLIPSAEGAVVELADGEHLTYVCAAGNLAAHIGTRLELRNSLSGLSVLTGETLSCEDSETDGRVDADACRAVGAVSMVCVPLRRASEPIGALKVSAAHARAFSAGDVAKLAGLAEFISVAVGAVGDLSRITGALSAGPGYAAASQVDGAGSGSPPGAGDEAQLSEFIANVLRPGVVADLATKQRIEQELSQPSVTMYCQPIVSLASGHLVGVEALARFAALPHQPPDAWFADADMVGLGVELQLATLEEALRLITNLPPDAFLAINVGPDAIAAAPLPGILRAAGPDRVVLELTEHLKVEDHPTLKKLLQTIRGAGVRLAIDDTGAGFASLENIVNLAPDLIKLDRQFTRHIDLDPVRRALAQALVSFAADTGAQVIAEGIENEDELKTVRDLGIAYGQGYFIARPAPIENMPRSFPQLPEHSVAYPR